MVQYSTVAVGKGRRKESCTCEGVVRKCLSEEMKLKLKTEPCSPPWLYTTEHTTGPYASCAQETVKDWLNEWIGKCVYRAHASSLNKQREENWVSSSLAHTHTLPRIRLTGLFTWLFSTRWHDTWGSTISALSFRTESTKSWKWSPEGWGMTARQEKEQCWGGDTAHLGQMQPGRRWWHCWHTAIPSSQSLTPP